MITNFQKIKLVLKKQLKELKERAIEEGIDLMSNEYKEVERETKKRILSNLGVDLNEYEDMEEAQGGKEGGIDKMLLLELAKMKGLKGETGPQGERGERGEDGYTPIKGKDYFDGKDGKNGRDGRDGRDGIDGKDGEIVNVKEIEKDLQTLQESHSELFDKVSNLSKPKDWEEKIKDLNWRIENINFKRASVLNRSDAGSFDTAISDSRYYKKGETINSRITPRVGTTTSSATPTINTDNVDIYLITAQAADITSFTTNLSGTPTNGQKLWISITGTAARAITWGSSFESSTVSLPTTTVTTARLDVGFVWNTATSKWRCVAQA